jgi:hypothetical protein
MTEETGGNMNQIFRREAVDHHFRSAVLEGEPLRLSSAPMRWTFWLLLSVIGAALTFAAVASVGEFVTGPAIVRVDEAAASSTETAAPGMETGGTCSLTAYLPARHLPRLRPGLHARVLLTGLDAEQWITLDAVEPHIVPAAEVRRILEDPAALPSNEPAVAVVRPLDTCTVRLGAHETPYVDGMQATLEVRIRSRSVLSSLLPGLGGGAP